MAGGARQTEAKVHFKDKGQKQEKVMLKMSFLSDEMSDFHKVKVHKHAQ